MRSFTGDIELEDEKICISDEELSRFIGCHADVVRHYYDDDDIEYINDVFEEIQENLSEAHIHVKTKEEALELGRLSTQELAQKFNISEESAAVYSDELLSYYFGHLILECIEKIGHCEFYSEDKDVLGVPHV